MPYLYSMQISKEKISIFTKSFLIGFFSFLAVETAGMATYEPAKPVSLLPKSVTAGESFLTPLTPTPTPAILITPKPTATPTPSVYPKDSDMIGHEELDCEKMAKDAQKKYGGSLIFLVGKDTNNNYILGDYAGHWINKVYVKELNKIQYIDYQNQLVYDDLEMMERDFRNAKGYAAVDSFDMEEGRPPFNLIWHT